jgi:hypothetical protein
MAISNSSILSFTATSTDKKIVRNFSSSVFSLLRDWDNSKFNQVASSDSLEMISFKESSFAETSKIPPEICHTISEIK